MKKATAIILCLCMLISSLTGCAGGSDKSSDKNSDKSGGKNPALSGQQGSGQQESGQSGNSSGGGNPNLNINPPKASEALSIANKYYDYHSGVVTGDIKSELNDYIGGVNFNGSLKDDGKAEILCSYAALIAVFQGDGDCAVASAAAAIGWSSGYPRSSGTLASVLLQAGFVTDNDRLSDAKKLAEYAISLDKNDINFYITLALILQEQGDNPGALAAIDAALAIESGDRAALSVKLNLLAASGAPAGEAKKIIGELDENDGKLGRRAKDQENKAGGMDDPKEEDSKDEALRKLEDLYSLEPITPADMMGAVFPEQSKAVKDLIMDVSGETDLGLPEYPAKLINDLDVLAAGLSEYAQWHTSRYMELVDNMNSIRSSSDIASPSDEWTSADYMREYNEQVVHAAIENYLNFCWAVWTDVDDEIANQERLFEIKKQAADKQLDADLAAGKLDALVKWTLTLNQATRDGANVLRPLLDNWYREVRREGQRFWEETLPFARCTSNPGGTVASLYSYVIDHSAPAFQAAGLLVGFGQYAPGFEKDYYAALAEAEAALAAARKADALKIPKTGSEDDDDAFVAPLLFGELKIKPNCVEFEGAAILALRAKFDWESMRFEGGAGLGGKLNIGAVEVGAAAYRNVVLDIRSGEVTETYDSGTAGVGAGGSGFGLNARYSSHGGTQISRTAKQAYGSHLTSLEREKVIFKTESE